MDRRGRRSLLIILGGLATSLALLWAWALPGRPPNVPLFEQAVGELKRRELGEGFHQGVALATPHRRLTRNGTVDLVRTADGRSIVLFKTAVGWKGNYLGVIASDAPLKPCEVGADSYGRPAITVRGLDAVIERKIYDRHCEVFFELG